MIVCAHDHKAVVAQTTEMLVTQTPDYSPTGSALPRRLTYQNSASATVVSVNQLRIAKRANLNHRDGVGSLDHISLASSTSSIRKMKSDVLLGAGRLDRSRTGSTPMSDAPSEQRTPHAVEEKRSGTGTTPVVRPGTPTSLAESHDGSRHASVPEFTAAESSTTTTTTARPKFDAIHPGEAESVVSDPGDRGDESSSDDDASIANTDGQFPNDAYSEEDSSAHRSAPSFSEKGGDNEYGVSKQLPESFKLPIMPFPPSTDVAPVTSARNLSRNLATAARIRTRQRGLERRLGITDTWASDRLISKQISTPTDVDLMSTGWNPTHSVIQEESCQTARDLRSQSTAETRDAHQRHRRTTSEQNLYLNSLKESLKNVGDAKKTKVLNYGKLLESVEERLIVLAAKQKEEIRDVDPELMSVLKLLDADDYQKQIGAFFEAETVEKTIQLVHKLTSVLNAATVPNDAVTTNVLSHLHLP